MKKIFAPLAVLGLFALQTVQGIPTAVYWDFGAAGSGGNLAPAQNPWSGLSVANWGVGNVHNGSNPLLAPNSVSSGYTTAAGFAASGATNAEAAIVAGTFNTASSTFFSTAFTLDISSPVILTIGDVSFGSRSTATGPTAFSVVASTDGFVSDFEQLGSTVAGLANSAYAAMDVSSLSFDLDPGETISLRLYGSSGTGTSSPANWRVDDFAVNFESSLVPTPEPSVLALATLGGLAGLFALRRKV